jgi:hypothetical protein
MKLDFVSKTRVEITTEQEQWVHSETLFFFPPLYNTVSWSEIAESLPVWSNKVFLFFFHFD